LQALPLPKFKTKPSTMSGGEEEWEEAHSRRRRRRIRPQKEKGEPTLDAKPATFTEKDMKKVLRRSKDLREYCKRLWGSSQRKWPPAHLWPALLGDLLQSVINDEPWKLAWISDSYHIDWKKLLLSRLTKAYERDLKTARREELLAAGMDIADSDDDSLSLEIEELKVEEKEEEVTDRGQSPLATDYLTASSSRNDGEAVVFDTEATSFSSNTLENNVYDADEVLTMDTEDANNDDVTEMIRRSKWKGLSCYDKQQTASVAAIGCRTQVRASLYTMTSLLPQIFRFLKGDELAQFGRLNATIK